ncbi:dephospho-CoA kinase [Botrimarina sp.]|uniref:dephospho-CoA kinase n=1 Tax=Botrimarina sp. TaxID=2795802 RepID=UPI0032EB7E60
MIVFGLTGGIASGKSYVAALFGELGAVVLDADRYAHTVLAEPEVVSTLRNRWGDAVVDSAGAVVKSELARRVFGPHAEAAAERAFLESVVHPRVRQRLESALAEAEAAGAAAAVLDIPLLVEAGWAERCDAVCFVDTPRPVRLERARRRGWSDAEFARREAAQTDLDAKRLGADAVVPGDDPRGARRAVQEIWRGRVAEE